MKQVTLFALCFFIAALVSCCGGVIQIDAPRTSFERELEQFLGVSLEATTDSSSLLAALGLTGVLDNDRAIAAKANGRVGRADLYVLARENYIRYLFCSSPDSNSPIYGYAVYLDYDESGVFKKVSRLRLVWQDKQTQAASIQGNR